MTPARFHLPLLAGALALAACTGSSSSPSPTGTLRAARGAITAVAASSITVNGARLATGGAVVREDGAVVGDDRLTKGTVVRLRGSFDDRTGTAVEIEIEHGLEGRVDDKGTDFVTIGGQVVHVDDSTEFERAGRLGAITAGPGGTVVRVSGVPDDKGGLRASRVDDSPRNGGAASDDDDVDVKGFVAALSGSTFQLRISPDATAYWMVDASGIALPQGLANGASVEVHTATSPVAGTPPVLGTLVASAIEVEDRFGEAEVEVEGIATSVSGDPAMPMFVIDGQTVHTSASTSWQLGTPADLVPGVEVEAEGSLVGDVLEAEKVSFRPGARISAAIDAVAADGTSITMLGIRVQTPSFMDDDVGALTVGAKVEVRGNPAANGTGLVASRVTNPSGNVDRVFIRAVATAKANASPAAPTFTVMGFTVTTAGATFRLLSDGPAVSADAFYAAVEAGHTVVKVQARSAADVDVGARTVAAEELEIEGHD